MAVRPCGSVSGGGSRSSCCPRMSLGAGRKLSTAIPRRRGWRRADRRMHAQCDDAAGRASGHARGPDGSRRSDNLRSDSADRARPATSDCTLLVDCELWRGVDDRGVPDIQITKGPRGRGLHAGRRRNHGRLRRAQRRRRSRRANVRGRSDYRCLQHRRIAALVQAGSVRRWCYHRCLYLRPEAGDFRRRRQRHIGD